MQTQLLSELTAHDCKCRVCGAMYIGHGALCALCHARMYAPSVQAVDVIAERDRARRARRRAVRRRREWVEIV